MREPHVLRLDRVELAPFERGRLRVLDRALDRALAVGITHAACIGNDAVVREHGAIHRIQFRSVEIGADHPFPEVVEHEVLGAPAACGPGLLMQLRPDLLVGLPHHLPEALARVLERHHEQIPALVFARVVERGRALSVVDLRFPGEKLQHVEALRCACLKRGDEALDRLVAVAKVVALDEILVDAHGVAPERDLRLDPRPVRLARRGARRRACRWRWPLNSRWPGWGNLPGLPVRAGGHPGGICPRRVAADGLAIDSGAPCNLVLARAALQQRFDSDA